MSKESKVTFFRNTPFTDFNNTLNFPDNETRDKWFDNRYDRFTYMLPFNFIRDRLIMTVGSEVKDWVWLSECNYLRFVSDFDDITYYCMVVEAKYINDRVTELTLVIDGLMTFCQGDISKYAKNVMIEREHFTQSKYDANLKLLRSNDDILNIPTTGYVHQDGIRFDSLTAVFTASTDLSGDMGDEDDPKLKTSAGIKYDGIVSPQNLYATKYESFNDLMGVLKDYPWVSQNISKIMLIPTEFIDQDDLEPVAMKVGSFSELMAFKSGHKSKNLTDNSALNADYNKLVANFNYPQMIKYKELMRKPYVNIELTNYQGQNIELDPALLPDRGLEIIGAINVGYNTNAYFFPRMYNDEGENILDQNLFGTYTGSYLHNALVFNQWDDIPMLIDNYRLNKANTAHERALNQNNLVSGLAGNVVDNSKDLQTRLMSAASLTSNLSPTSLMGKMTDEWQFYRRQNAHFEDMAIAKPTITDMTNSNSFAIKQNVFGVYVKYSRIDNDGLEAVQRYHAHFGYKLARVDDLEPIDSMRYVNYAKFSGNWNIYDRHVPQSIMEQIRVQLENGVKFWHNPNSAYYPFAQNIDEVNDRVK